MTKPHQIDREAVALVAKAINDRAGWTEYGPIIPESLIEPIAEAAIVALYSRPAPMEAVAWREKVIGLIDRYLHGIEHEETTNPDGWWETSRGAAFGAKVKDHLQDAILALIATHPVQGGEG